MDGGVGMIWASKLCNMGMCVAFAGMLCLIGSVSVRRDLFLCTHSFSLSGFCGVWVFMIVYPFLYGGFFFSSLLVFVCLPGFFGCKEGMRRKHGIALDGT